ncbi:MAG: dipicolinate synthase subunit B [Clostridiales bacterium]|jgi:dipicolinate synthase subunit B|nr:dipicolinate synthase subunit B [Clostridiales bacterium]
MKGITAGFALCGSFCTFSKAIEQIEVLVNKGVKVTPIMSGTAYETDTRFGKAEDFIRKIEDICGNKVLSTLTGVEPIGPKKYLDILIIEPCTGNTIGKLANGITDSCVTLAAKAHLRNHRPVLIGVSTNDALGASAANIGKLLNRKYLYFIPMRQDEPTNKPNSIVADFTKTYDAMLAALEFKQIQPIMI